MSRVSESTLDQIRSRLDIVELIREYLPGIKRAGRHFKALCPFHSEKTPSFMVNQEKQIFHCFGCGEGGDVVKFLMKMENMSFPQAVEDLAARAGVRLEAAAGALSVRDKERLSLRKALEFAVGFYRDRLRKSPQAHEAREYLIRRRISPESQEAFQLGFASGEGTVFLEAALQQSLSPQVLERSGLIGFQADRGRYYDYFRDRLLFPIFSTKGEILGFGGRVLDDREPKYLNSPETALFSKGKVLYGLWQAAPSLRKARRAVVLEGYTDVIACHRFGFMNAVAPLGTALTQDHAAMLKRFSDGAVLLFDPDVAGAQASLRGAELLMEADFGVRIATLPGGLDPDEFLEQSGAGAFSKLIDEAVDLAEFKTEMTIAALPRNPGIEEKARAAGAVLETIAKQPNHILREEWARRLARRLDLEPEALSREMARKYVRKTERPSRAAELPGRKEGAGPKASPAGSRKASAGEELLQFYFKHPEWLDREPRPLAADIADLRVARALETMRRAAAEGASSLAAALAELIPEDAGWLTGLAMDERPVQEPADFIEKIIRSLRREKAEARWKELQALQKEREFTLEELEEQKTLHLELRGSDAPR